MVKTMNISIMAPPATSAPYPREPCGAGHTVTAVTRDPKKLRRPDDRRGRQHQRCPPTRDLEGHDAVIVGEVE
jgi:putative NADH-flavin reductase